MKILGGGGKGGEVMTATNVFNFGGFRCSSPLHSSPAALSKRSQYGQLIMERITKSAGTMWIMHASIHTFLRGGGEDC